ncbi:MAG: class I SAM-dependent methyltransferase [Nitrosotalea sp.]
MQQSRLGDIYSLSDKITRKEFLSRIKNDVGMIGLTLDLMKYVDIYTGKVKSEFCIIRDRCPLCDSKKYSYLFNQHGFDHMLCDSCDLIFTLQVLDESKIQFLQEGDEGDAYGKYKDDPVVSNFDRQKFEIVFEELEKHTKIKNIFDFGSQIGTFLDWAREKYSITGHEYHTPLRNVCLKKGHIVSSENLASIKFDREFDLITCWDYIDHVLNPHGVVENLSKYLKKGGLFFFAINNRDSLSARIMHKYSPIFIGPHHTMHYGINQLKLLMKDYELIYSESYVSELNWISNWLNFKNPEIGDSPLMFELFDPKKICELGMGFKLNAIFKKK